ncbi:methyltransferase domain-containing protein [Polynucleobacter paneuropaeus]|nr:methyltransferase domain-containing protein [Polynucleobacter paneuropaeus]
MLVSFSNSTEVILSKLDNCNNGCGSITISGVLPIRPNQDNILLFQYQSNIYRDITIQSSGVKVITDGCFYQYENECYPSLLNINFILEIVFFDNNKKILSEHSIETLFLPKHSKKYFDNYSRATQQDKANLSSLYSCHRFLQSLNDGVLSDYDLFEKSIFVSGFGTGREISALLQLGAGVIVGFDPDKNSIDIAKSCFYGDPRVLIASHPSEVKNYSFDIVISRHVIEHIPSESQEKYFLELASKVKPSGLMVLEFPNGEYPIDPHTGVHFFHLLPIEVRRKIFNLYADSKLQDEIYMEKLGGITHLFMPSLNDVLSIAGCFWRAKKIRPFSDLPLFKNATPQYYEVLFQMVQGNKAGLNSYFKRAASPIRFLKYFFVGGMAASVDIGLFSFFASYLGWPWLPVSILTFILATLVNYYLSINFVFKSGVRYKKRGEITGVFMVSGLALLVNQIVLYISIDWLLWNLIFAKIFATSIVFFWNYFGRSRFVF